MNHNNNNRMQWGWLKPLAVLASALALAACVQVEEPAPSPLASELAPVSAVSVVHPGFEVKAGDTVAWRSEMLWVGDDSDGGYRQALTRLNIDKEIERQLTAEGLTFVDPARADYMLIAVVMIGDHPDGVALQELARLYPSLGNISQTLEKGTLMMGISHPGSPVVMWRGAIQTYISGDVPPAQRQLRMQSVVRSLLNTLPLASR